MIVVQPEENLEQGFQINLDWELVEVTETNLKLQLLGKKVADLLAYLVLGRGTCLLFQLVTQLRL